MILNPAKCVTLHCTIPSTTCCYNQEIKLGVMHFYFMDQEVINKASKTLDFVKYTLYQFDLSVKVDAYNTLMRPILFKIRINNI